MSWNLEQHAVQTGSLPVGELAVAVVVHSLLAVVGSLLVPVVVDSHLGLVVGSLPAVVDNLLAVADRTF